MQSKLRLMGAVALAACAVWLLMGMINTQPAALMAESTGEEEFKRTVSVTGEVTKKIQPDLAVLSVAVKTEADNAARAANWNAELTDEVIKALIKAGVKDEDISTQNYSLQENRRWVEKEYVVDGYVVTNTITFTTTSLDDIGKMIDAAVNAGANVIYSPTFTVKDQQALKLKLLEEAMQNAKTKAATLVNSVDASLGPVITIAEQSINGNWYYGDMVKAAEGAVAAYAETRIMPGEVQLTARVHVVFAIR